MIDENSTFGGFLTEIGEAKQSNANALNQPWKLTHMLLGDAKGTDPVPEHDQTQLINQVHRAAINQLSVDPDNPAILIAELVLPPDVGGWWIRELGIEDEDGDFVAVANCAPSYKPLLAQGSGRNQVVRMHLILSNTANVELKVDPSVVLATRQYVDQERAEHEASRAHPLATTIERGMVIKATTSEARNGVADKFPDAANVYAILRHFGLTRSIKLNDADDLNNINSEGIYAWAGATPAHSPPGEQYGAMLVIADPQPCQIVFGGTTGHLYQRRRNSGSWSDNWTKFWSTADQGAGSGMDADLLDGLEAAFLRNASNLNAGTVPVARLPAATESAMGAAEVATQPETDTGDDDTRFVSPKKLKNWAANWVKQATEAVAGMLKVATQDQTDAGTDDTTAVTPKKLRWGVSYNLKVNGYIALPSWLGGLTFQWALVDVASGDGETLNFPIAFPTACLTAVATDHGTGSVYALRVDSTSNTGVTFTAVDTIGGTLGGGGNIRFLAIGY